MSQTVNAVGLDGLDHSPGCMFIILDGIEPCSCDATRKQFSERDPSQPKGWWYRCWERWMRVRVSPEWWARSDGQQPKWPVEGPHGQEEGPWVPGVDYDDSPETSPRVLAAMRVLRQIHAEETTATVPPALWEFNEDAQRVLTAVDAADAPAMAAAHRVYEAQLARLKDCRFDSSGEHHVRLATAESALTVLFLAVPGQREYLEAKNGAEQ